MGDPNEPPPNDRPPSPSPMPPLALPPILVELPNIETRSSRGLLDVPDSRLAAAGVDDRTSVAASPDGWPSVDGASSKSKRFSACWPATTVCSAF